MNVIDNVKGSYRFLPGIAPFASGAVAMPGYQVVHATLRRPTPWRKGFELIDAHHAEQKRPRAALCAIELVNARLVAFGVVPKPAPEPYRSATRSLDDALAERRRVWFGGRALDCPVWERERLPERAELDGPAIVEEFGATTVMLPGWRGALDDHGNMRLEHKVQENNT